MEQGGRCCTRIAGAIVLGLALAPAAARPDDSFEPLSDALLCMDAAHYVPQSRDQVYVGNVQGRAGLLRWKATTLFLDARIETILGTERRETDANQGSYHIEMGFDYCISDTCLTPFFHHVSRHELDRYKPEAVDWNVAGLRLNGPWPGAPGRWLRGELGLGHTTLASLIGYRWELTARLDGTLFRHRGTEIHGRAASRLVTTEPNDFFPRNHILDASLELATRWSRGARSAEAFVAWEQRSDVELTHPSTRSRLLIGFRLGLADGRPDQAVHAPVASPTARQAGSTR